MPQVCSRELVHGKLRPALASHLSLPGPETSEVLCDPVLALCLASDVRDHNWGQDSQTVSRALRKFLGIRVCVYQMEGGQVLLYLNSQKHSRSYLMI